MRRMTPTLQDGCYLTEAEKGNKHELHQFVIQHRLERRIREALECRAALDYIERERARERERSIYLADMDAYILNM